jgi:hypothetical protein
MNRATSERILQLGDQGGAGWLVDQSGAAKGQVPRVPRLAIASMRTTRCSRSW